MKAFMGLILSSLASITVLAADDTSPIYCPGLSLINPANRQLEATGISIRVDIDASAPYGRSAKMQQGSTVHIEKDVKVEEVPVAQMGQLKDLAQALRPDLNWRSVRSVRIANIGVQANSGDGAGSYLYEMRGSRGQMLGILASYGWTYGLCR